MQILIKKAIYDKCTYFTVQTQHKQHQEENYTPKLWQWHKSKGFRVGNEGKTGSGLGNISDIHFLKQNEIFLTCII